jgi:hypothetical protein
MQGGHSVGLCYKCMLSDAQRDNIKRV